VPAQHRCHRFPEPLNTITLRFLTFVPTLCYKAAAMWFWLPSALANAMFTLAAFSSDRRNPRGLD
jgi:hypothetical protein